MSSRELCKRFGISQRKLEEIFSSQLAKNVQFALPDMYTTEERCIINDVPYKLKFSAHVKLVPCDGEFGDNHHGEKVHETQNLFDAPPITDDGETDGGVDDDENEELKVNSEHIVDFTASGSNDVPRNWYDIIVASSQVSSRDVRHAIPNKSYTIVELFAGCGGMALGMEEAGFNTVGLIEMDKNCCRTLSANRGNWQVIQGDIRKVCGDDALLRDKILSKCGETGLDVLSGGFPCQSFSTMGKQLGMEDERGTMFQPFAVLLEKLKPKVFVAENVKGLITHNQGRSLSKILTSFASAGYKVHWKLLNSVDYGVGQSRQRIIIIGIRIDLSEVQFNYPEKLDHVVTLRQALQDVPSSPHLNYPPSKSGLFKHVKPGGNWRDVPQEILLSAPGFSAKKKPTTQVLKRLSWDEPCPVLMTTPICTRNEKCHPDETRPLSLRESARVQSFPDSWEFFGSVTDVYKQIGNAVPVNMAKMIGLSVVSFLNECESMKNGHLMVKEEMEEEQQSVDAAPNIELKFGEDLADYGTADEFYSSADESMMDV